MRATYTKLRSGAWGIRIESDTKPVEGTDIEVTKKDGTVKTEPLVKIVWSGDGLYICAIAAQEAPAPTADGPLVECGDCGQMVPAGRPSCEACGAYAVSD